MANLNTTTIFYNLAQVEAHYRKSAVTFVLASDWTTCDVAHTIVTLDRLGKLEDWIVVFEGDPTVAPTWVERQIDADVKSIVRNGGVVILVGPDSVADHLSIDAEVIDLGAAMIDACRVECDRAGASWDLVAATQADKAAPNQDRLVILQSRAKVAVFDALMANTNGIILIGLLNAYSWGATEQDITKYMMGRTERGLDRNNHNKFIFTISEIPFADRMIGSKQTPDTWGGNRSTVTVEEEWQQVVTLSPTARELREMAAQQAIEAESDAKAKAERDRIDAFLAASSQTLRDKRIGWFEIHRSALVQYAKMNTRKGRPTKKAMGVMFSALSRNLNDTLFLTTPEARPHFEEWLIDAIS